jgi:protocatechuate 3,4-dioxygenase beta subunit
MKHPNRRDLFRVTSVGGLWLAAGAPSWAQELTPTPSNIEGPFFKMGAPKSDKLSKDGDAGLPLVVEGKVLSRDGSALADATVEVWHADPDGKYDNEAFHFRASVPVDKDGRYRFETIFPGHYGIGGYGEKDDSMRPQHVHFKVGAPGHEGLVTQLYFETDPFFEGNPTQTIKKDPFVKHRRLVVPVQIHRKVKAYSTSANFDIVLAKAGR